MPLWILAAGGNGARGFGCVRLQQSAFGCVLDEGRQRHEHVGLRVCLFLRDAVHDNAGAALDILHADAGRLGESIELRLIPVRRAVMQPVGAIDGDNALRLRRSGDDGGQQRRAER